MNKFVKLILVNFSMLLLSSGAYGACTVVEYTEYWCPTCAVAKNRGVAYAKGSVTDCKAACKTWGTQGTNIYTGVTYKTYYFAYYNSHPYWFPADARMKCEVTDTWDYWRGNSVAPACPIHYDGGIPSCNY